MQIDKSHFILPKSKYYENICIRSDNLRTPFFMFA